MMSLKPNHLLPVVCCVLAACASTPQLQFHTLVPPATQSASLGGYQGEQTDAFAIEVVPISVPEIVDRPQLVVRLADATGLRVLEQQQWASPLQSEVRNAVSFALSSNLGTRDVYNVDYPAVPVYRVAVTVQRFETIIGGTSTLQAAWSVRKPDSDQLASCQTRVRFVNSGSVDRAVAGFQQAIGVVANSIATVVRGFASDQQPQCPAPTESLE